MNILVLQPYRLDTPKALRDRARALLDVMVAAHPEHAFTVVHRPGVVVDPLPGAYGPHAAVRNQLIDALLQPWHDTVLWVDVDLISYPADILRQLLALGGVAAPAIILDKAETFYDLGGFIEDGRPFRPYRPWCNQPGPVVELDSVGCLCVVPADVYRRGARYRPDGPCYGVEHYSVCQAAKDMGYPVRADLSIEVRHAWLPDYGEALR